MVKCADSTLYTGYTSNLEQRMKQHNSRSQGARYTRTRRPVKLVFVEIFSTQKEAIHREIAIKKLTRDEKLNLIKLSPIKPPESYSSEKNQSE